MKKLTLKNIEDRIYSTPVLELRQGLVEILKSSSYPIEDRKRMLNHLTKKEVVKVIINNKEIPMPNLLFIKESRCAHYIPLIIEELENVNMEKTSIVFDHIRETLIDIDSSLEKKLSGNKGKSRITSMINLCMYEFRGTKRKGDNIRVLRKIRGSELYSLSERTNAVMKKVESLGLLGESKNKIPEGLI